MVKETIALHEAGQRLDKYLHKYLPEASSSFLYKMLRKKNITLNTGKAEGSEKLQTGDEVTLFLSDETINKFRGNHNTLDTAIAEYHKAYNVLKNRFQVVYEDANILLLNKSAGVLTQKAVDTDLSLNEAMIGYLLQTGALHESMLTTFKPSVCNRLDRNTSGIVICGKSLAGLQCMSTLLKERTVHKFYRCIVIGQMTEPSHLEGYLTKNEHTNQVTITQTATSDSSPIITNYRPLQSNGPLTLVEVELITGKTHQIRAHLASVGYPILLDYKYGNRRINQTYQNTYLVNSQLLHAYRVLFPILDGDFSSLSEKTFVAPLPTIFDTIMKG
ncbi:MAG: RluA family pseudouridine synthase [Lachnospiraceae bacterium]